MKSRSSNISSDEEQRRLAVLIDADNAQASMIEGVLAEVAKFGVASVKRIYGNFTSPQLGSWKDTLLKYSISPVQQFAYTTGKNATDSCLIIDAMDLMYTGRFDGFCLISSDSDFTRLAQRLREQGLTVYGFGQHKTPPAFREACDKFIYTELLRAGRAGDDDVSDAARAKAAAPPPTARAPVTKRRGKASDEPAASAARPAAAAPLPVPVALIRQAIEEGSDEGGWAHLGGVGKYLNKIRPDFDPRRYGRKKLSELVRQENGAFELEERVTAGGAGKALYVRALE